MESTAIEHQDFQELLKLAAGGDQLAQQAICARYEKQVMIAARVLLGPLLRPHLDSVDIVQSVHRSLLGGLQKGNFDIRSPEKLISLASTMARRKVANKWRTHQRQLRLDISSSQYPLPELLSLLTSHDEDPHKASEHREQLENLCAHLNNIERTMLEMRMAGYSTGEVANHLGINPVAIRVRWTRLRQRLQQAGINRELL